MPSTSTLPALLGGTPIRPEGPPAWPIPDEDVLLALQQAYRDGSWGKYQGRNSESLVEQLGQAFGVAHVLTCGSGTFAVELALRALKVGPGDEVILAAYDYPGNFLAVHAVGALPVLVDVACSNWNLDPDRVQEALGPASKAVIASHLHGGLVPMADLMALARQRGLAVIEDAAQQPGALVDGQPAGTWGDVGILSFGGSKLLSAGRGGALLTNRADVYQRARLWQNRGNIVNPLSELQAAVLLPQLAKLAGRNAQRAAAVQHLADRLHGLPGLRLFANSIGVHAPAFYKVGWQLAAQEFGLDRERLSAAVRAEGIALDEGFRALHVGRSPSRFRRAGSLAEADQAHRGCLVLHHPVLLANSAEVDQVAQAVHKVYLHREQLRQYEAVPAMPADLGN